mmetsp:Transcript_30367/g.46347  ORF Transcript_30367/g.46347 Transcript_30367/m.46347 type:complete len:169 (-) Transcript_30367:54-560(-)
MSSQKAESAKLKVQASVLTELDESLLNDSFFSISAREESSTFRKGTDARSVSSNMSLSSFVSLPSSSRVFQIFSTVVFLVVFLTCGMFVRHSMTMSRLRGGEVSDISRRKRVMTSNGFEPKLPMMQAPITGTSYGIIRENSKEGVDIAESVLEETVNSVINQLSSSET